MSSRHALSRQPAQSLRVERDRLARLLDTMSEDIGGVVFEYGLGGIRLSLAEFNAEIARRYGSTAAPQSNSVAVA